MLVAHDVDAGDVGVDAAGRVDADHLAPEVACAEHELRRHLPVAQDPLAVVDVGDEQVERVDALDHAALDVIPLLARDHAGDQVEREDPLEPFLLAVDREADALIQERGVDGVPPRLELLDAQRREPLGEHAVVRPGLPRRLEHLVEERTRVVAALVGEDGGLGGRGGHESEVPSPFARVGGAVAARAGESIRVRKGVARIGGSTSPGPERPNLRCSGSRPRTSVK